MANIIPEAQLQAYVVSLVRDALPHLPPESFRVEKWLNLRLGGGTHKEDGAKYWAATGRADFVIYHKDRPLAVFELKKEDLALEQDNLDQARSYAMVMLEQPPLVIVSNGKDTWVRQAADGEPLNPVIEGADFAEKLFANVGKLAAANLTWAIETLMGPDASVWIEAVRQRTDELIERQTGDAHQTRKPFVRDRLFARSATGAILELLSAGAKTVVLEGSPLAGKSNVLRHLAAECRDSPDWAVLMVNAATRGPGLFQRLANILGEALEWKLSDDDVRTWLRRMSRSTRRPCLVLAVDGLQPSCELLSDLEELAELGFGSGLRIVATTDRADDLLVDTRGRGESALAVDARVVRVGRLDGEEFQAVREELARERILFFGGAELSLEYRAPWILRTVLADGEAPDDENQVAVIPATLGLRIIEVARARLAKLGEVARLHRLIARNALADEETPDPQFALAQSNAYVVRRDALDDAGSAAAAKLEQQGWVSFHRHRTGEDVVVFRAPEFFLCELASELAEILDRAIEEDVDEAAVLLIWQSHRFFLGDIAGAQALIDLAVRGRALPGKLIEPLMNDWPETESMAGKLIGLATASGEIVNLRFDEHGGIARANAQGIPIEPFEPRDEDDSISAMHGNMTSWMILSQLAQIPTALGTADDRLDVEIIGQVGRCDTPLMRGGLDPEMAYETQHLGRAGTVLALRQALAEPITAAIHKLVTREWRDLLPFFESLEKADSLPLTVRVHNVLISIRGSVDTELDTFSEKMLRTIVHPLLRKQIEDNT